MTKLERCEQDFWILGSFVRKALPPWTHPSLLIVLYFLVSFKWIFGTWRAKKLKWNQISQNRDKVEAFLDTKHAAVAAKFLIGIILQLVMSAQLTLRVSDYGDSVYVGVQEFLRKNADIMAKQVYLPQNIEWSHYCVCLVEKWRQLDKDHC